MGNKAILFTLLISGGIFYTLKKPFIGVLLFVIITYIRPNTITWGQTRPFAFSMTVSVVFIFSWLIHRSTLPVVQNQSRVLLFLWWLVFFQMVSSITAVVNSSLSFTYAMNMLKLVVFCYLVLQLIDTEKKFFQFIGANLVGASFIAIWAFQQHFRGNSRLEEVAGGSYNDSNGLATLMVHFAPIFLSFLFFKQKKLKVLGVIMTLVMISDIIFSQSRSALLGIGAAFLVMLLKVKMKYRVGILLFALAVSPLVKKAILDTEGYAERIQVESMEKERGASRIPIWKGGIMMFLDYMWTGVGQQNFQYLSRYYAVFEDEYVSFKVGDAHNTLILIACEGGLFAVTAYLLALICFFINTYQLKKVLSNGYDHYVILLNAFEAGTVGLLVSGMFHSYPYMENYYWILISPGILMNIFTKKTNDGRMIWKNLS